MNGWTQSRVEGRAYDVFRPPSPHVHGYTLLLLRDEEGVLPQAMRRASTLRLLHELQLTIIAPNAGPLWALDVALPGFPPAATPRQLLVDQILPQALSLVAHESPRIGLFGFGMGGQAALRLAYDYAARFPVVAAIEPKIDFHLYVKYGGNEPLQEMFADDELARQHTAILHVHPLNWPRQHFFCCDPLSPWFDGSDRLRMKLSASGIPFEADLETSTDGDPETYVTQQVDDVLRWLSRALDKERLRLV